MNRRERLRFPGQLGIGLAGLLFAGAACGERQARPAIDNQNISRVGMPAMADASSSLERFGAMVPLELVAEAQIGIRDCFLSERTLAELSQQGFTLIRCTADRAVVVKQDLVGLARGQDVDRQPLAISVNRPSPLPYPLENSHLMASDEIAADVEALIRRRFNVAADRTALSYWAMVDPAHHFLGGVIVSAGRQNICEFKFFDERYPQTRCIAQFDDFMIGISTNSTDYEAIQGLVSALSQIDWRHA